MARIAAAEDQTTPPAPSPMTSTLCSAPRPGTLALHPGTAPRPETPGFESSRPAVASSDTTAARGVALTVTDSPSAPVALPGISVAHSRNTRTADAHALTWSTRFGFDRTLAAE